MKTYGHNGTVYVTEKELKVAFEKRADYYLCGVIADDTPSVSWQTVLLPDPFEILLRHGKFDIDAKLQVRAADLFSVQPGAETS